VGFSLLSLPGNTRIKNWRGIKRSLNKISLGWGAKSKEKRRERNPKLEGGNHPGFLIFYLFTTLPLPLIAIQE
jgi:hypothetical protein